MNPKHSFRFLIAFVYPAALGAALSWEVQAVSVLWAPEGPYPSPWTLVFGAWFIVYHSVWYWFLINSAQDSEEVPKGFGKCSFFTNLGDAFILFGGFAALGLASGQYHPPHIGLAFLAAACLPLVATVVNRRSILSKGLKAIPPLAIACSFAVPLVGVYFGFMRGTIDATAWCVLVLQLGLLVWYWVWPEHFGSQRST